MAKQCLWGAVEHEEKIAPGITWVSTASHGGVILSRNLWLKIPEYARSTPYSQGGQYEEDVDWVIPVCCFPGAFEPQTVENARKILRNPKFYLGEVRDHFILDGILDSGVNT